MTTDSGFTARGFRWLDVDGAACICCSSNPTGSSTRRTFPMNPRSKRDPDLWSGLCLINVIRYTCEDMERDAYQLAMLWHAASSMGPPCVKKAGPSVEINSVNRVGYGNLDKRTTDLCNVSSQDVIKAVGGSGLPVCNHAWRTGLSFE
jgi:hypothetical protein